MSQIIRRLLSPRGKETNSDRGAVEHLIEGDENDLDPFDPFPDPVRLEVTDVFDLHSIPPRDVKRVVVEYLELARQAGFGTVRIIHGKGVGMQRETVRSILDRTPFVERFSDAPPDAGGWGATIVRLLDR